MTPREAMARHFQMVLRHGTDDEKTQVANTILEMTRMREEEPSLEWLPDDHVRLPSFLVARAQRVGAERYKKAERWLREYYGAERGLAKEVRTVEAQYALCLLLGLPFGDNLSPQTARKDGNVGFNISAFAPEMGNPSLIINERQQRRRQIFLMHDQGDHLYHARGWCRAGEYMIPEYEKIWERIDRHGHKHVALTYKVPPEMLDDIGEWWLRASAAA